MFKSKKSHFSILLAACLSLTPINGFATDFYSGKTLRLVVATSAGTGYDVYARVIARHLGKFLPGLPNITVENMPGGGGLRVANYIYFQSPKDGTVIGAVHSAVGTANLLNPEGVKLSAEKFNWIGSANKESHIAIIWHTSAIQTLQDVKEKFATVGATTLGTSTVDFPLIVNKILGYKFNIINGYEGTTSVSLAMERGEVEGLVGTTWTSLQADKPSWILEKKVRVIAQFGLEKHPDLKDVPLIIDLAKSIDDIAALKLVLSRQEYGRPYISPPETPLHQVSLLREAFSKTMNNEEFLAEASRMNIEINPVNGHVLQEIITEIAKTPAPIVDRVRKIFSQQK